MVLRNGHSMIGFLFWQKEEESRNSFNVARILTLPINSCTFEQFKDVQEKMLLILSCQTVYCYRKDLPSTSIYHVGNVSEVHSIIRNGLIPGWKSLKRRRQAVFFTTVNPMEERKKGSGETPRDLTKPRVTPYKNTWKCLQNTVCWCILKLAQEKDLQFYQTRHMQSFSTTHYLQLAQGKAECMKTQEELYPKVRLTPREPRIVLKSNSQFGQQDLQNQDARSSLEPSSDSKKLRRNLKQHRGPQNIWSTSFCSRAAEYSTRERSQEVDREVREPQA